MNSGLVVLLVAACCYCYAAGAEVLLVKVMNSKPVSVLLPLGTALLLNGYWPLQGLMYAVVWKNTAQPRPLTFKLVRGYAVIGSVAALVSGLRCIGISYMPGSVYVIISTADLPINTLMSKFLLGKSFEPLQYVSVLCAMAGIAVCMTGSQSDKAHTCDGDSCIDDWAPYITAALLSALCSAGNSVLGEFLLSKDKKNPILAVCEVSFFNSFVPFCTIGMFILCTQWWENNPHSIFYRGPACVAQYISPDNTTCLEDYYGCVHEVAVSCRRPEDQPDLRPWSQIWEHLSSSTATGGPHVHVFVMVAFGLCVSKMIDRVAKFYIVALQGAFFFALLDTFRRLATAIIAVIAFDEALTFQKVIALMLSILAIFLHSFASHKKAIRKHQRELFDEILGEESLEASEERLRRRYAMVRGLPDSATWEEIEQYDTNYRRQHKGVLRFDSDATMASIGEGAYQHGGSLSEFSPLGLSLGMRKARGPSAEDANFVLGASVSDSPQASGSREELGPAALAQMELKNMSWLARTTRSGLSVQEDFEMAVQYMHCDTDHI